MPEISTKHTLQSAQRFLSLSDIIQQMKVRTTIYTILDICSVTVVFFIFLVRHAELLAYNINRYGYSFLLFIGVWVLTSIISKKYRLHEVTDQAEILRKIVLSNLFILGICTSLMYLIRVDFYSRTVVFGTIVIVTVIELIWGMFDYYLRTAIIEPPDITSPPATRKRQLLREVFTPKKLQRKTADQKAREDAILVEIDQEAFEFAFKYAPIEVPETMVISTTSRFNIEMQRGKKFDSIVNLKRINDIRYVNKFFETANLKLDIGGIYIDYVETKNLRKKRILKKYPFLINYIAYFFDYLIKRVFPKFLLTKQLYFFLTRGQNRVFTKAETYGRLYSCGFEIIDEKYISKHLFFVARKIKNPYYPTDPSYGPFIKLKRVGYKGKLIHVYKMRTMHPYAEYLQEYVYQKEGLEKGGKFKSDFRISTIGKFLRMFWLDELPMFINLLKGELKIVGVRPLSQHYFSLYSKEHQERRIQYKPGLIPPYYADNPTTLDEIMESELRYMIAYDKHPLITDFRYFFKATYNIIVKKARSK